VAVSGTVAPFCHESEPPVTVGSLGGPRSMRIVAAGVPGAGSQAETLPAPSVPRIWTRVSPCAVSVSDEPGCAVVQVAPPSVDVRYS
jgi:hypothetical protein